MDYELLIIGEEQQGIERALAAARLGHRVAVIGFPETVPSLDLLRLAAFNMTEHGEVSMDAWRAEVARLVRCQQLAMNAELESAGIERIYGEVTFVSPTTLEVLERDGRRVITSREIVLATGTRSRMPRSLGDDDRFVFSVESMLNLKDIPRSMIVVGAGETGLSIAIMFAGLGVEVTVVDEHLTLLELCGLFDARFDAIQSLNIAFRLDDEVIGIEHRHDLEAAVRLVSGQALIADAVLVCVGKEGRTDGLNLEAAGVGIDERGRVWCDAKGQTWAEQISAVGDVVGFSRATAVPESHFGHQNRSFRRTSRLGIAASR